MGIFCSLNEPEALLLVSASGSLKTSQLASRERVERESSRADNYNAYHKLAVGVAEVWGSAIVKICVVTSSGYVPLSTGLGRGRGAPTSGYVPVYSVKRTDNLKVEMTNQKHLMNLEKMNG